MIMTVGSLTLVVAIYLGMACYMRASAVNQNAMQWALRTGLTYFATVLVPSVVIGLIFSAIGWPYYLSLWIALVIWFVVTMRSGPKCDALFESKLGGGPAA